ncbi:hypothetical protein SRABI128_06002 [Microbacterium sp. Bi128]|nr:hypothetical protein SRABI128_06002 [Microbacterium sp. Bi128]
MGGEGFASTVQIECDAEVDPLGLDQRAETQVGDGDDTQAEAQLGTECVTACCDQFGQRPVDAAEADQRNVIGGHGAP